MGVVMESFVWEPQPHIYLLLFCLSLLSIFLFPYLSSNKPAASVILDLGGAAHSQSSFLRFQTSFLLIYSLAALNQGLQSVFGEFEYLHYGFTKGEILGFLCVGSASALLIGTLLGVLSDLISQKKMCLTFCFLHLLVAISKILTRHPCAWIASICLALASSIFSFSFETWMVTQNDKIGYRQDMLSDTFWLMVFFESASLIGSQVLGNVLIGSDAKNGVMFPFIAIVLLAVALIIFIKKEWKETPLSDGIKDYVIAVDACIHDKKVWLLACAQSCLHFSASIFWILWAPTIVADGREVHLGLIYPCLMGARMLGSTAVPWFHSGFLQVRIEDCLIFSFSVAGLVLSIVAYDYQEIGVLVTLFCFFHVCVGILLPSLARLRTIYVPNELRGGMISLSLAPANAAIVFVLIQGGYFRSIENSTIMAFAGFALFSAAGCMHLLKQKKKQSHQNGHEL